MEGYISRGELDRLLGKNHARIRELKKEIKQLREVVELYLQHCGNNHQICGLNNRARELTAGKGNK